MSRRVACWGLAATLGLFLFASSAPSPLYVVYQGEWGFSAITLTSVFAVYALALLATLVVAGSVSDHVGRRPVLLVALAVEIAGMLLFAEAQSVGWLFAARTVQGVATGLAMGAISAALLDLQPDDKPRLGALLAAAAPLTGLAAGALTAGLLIQYGPDPTRLVYWLLLGGFTLASVFALAVPEPVNGDGRLREALRPEIAVPASMRGGLRRHHRLRPAARHARADDGTRRARRLDPRGRHLPRRAPRWVDDPVPRRSGRRRPRVWPLLRGTADR